MSKDAQLAWYWLGLFVLAGIYALGYRMGRRFALAIVRDRIAGSSVGYIAGFAVNMTLRDGIERTLRYTLAVVDAERAGGRPIDDKAWKTWP